MGKVTVELKVGHITRTFKVENDIDYRKSVTSVQHIAAEERIRREFGSAYRAYKFGEEVEDDDE